VDGRRLRQPLLALCLAAVCLALPWAAFAQRGEPSQAKRIPAATRLCGQGGDPSAPGKGTDARGISRRSPNPLAGLDLYVNKIQERAYSDMRRYQGRGQKAKAAAMARIALQPRGVWFGKFTRPNFLGKVRDHINCAQWLQPGSVPIMMVLRHQGKQCNPRSGVSI